jgi:hypothetical protein
MKKMLTYISRTVVISDSLSGTEEEAKEDEIEVAEDDQEPIYVSVGLEDIVSVGKFIQTPFSAHPSIERHYGRLCEGYCPKVDDNENPYLDRPMVE